MYSTEPSAFLRRHRGSLGPAPVLEGGVPKLPPIHPLHKSTRTGLNPTRPGGAARYRCHTKRNVGFPSMGMSRPGSRHWLRPEAEKVNVAKARSKYSNNFRRQAEAHARAAAAVGSPLIPRPPKRGREETPQSRRRRRRAFESVIREKEAMAREAERMAAVARSERLVLKDFLSRGYTGVFLAAACQAAYPVGGMY